MLVNDVMEYLGEFGERAGFIEDKNGVTLKPEFVNNVKNFKMNFGRKETQKEEH